MHSRARPPAPEDASARGVAGAEPWVVVDGRERQVLRADAAALGLGIRPGLALSAAHALARRLRVVARDVPAERAALAGLGAWAGQFTSLISLAPPQALLLEVAGSQRLFGGVQSLMEQVRQGLAELGYGARLALAPTPLAAQWLARAGVPDCVISLTQLTGALASLSLHGLDLDARRCRDLAAMGVRRVGDCLRLPRAGLAQRLGPDLLRQLDRALGRAPDPRPPFVPPSGFEAALALPGGVDTSEALLFPLRRLVGELVGVLRARNAGVPALQLRLVHVRGPATVVNLELVSISRETDHLLALLRERLAHLRLPGPVEEISLAASRMEVLADASLDLFGPAQISAESRARVVERLQARLGHATVRGLHPVAEHRPERAWRYGEPGTAANAAIATVERPLWLLPAPAPLVLRDGRPWLDGALRLEPVRERIESGWWDGEDIARDYFVAHDARGARLWIYRELTGPRGWYLHGVFA